MEARDKAVLVTDYMRKKQELDVVNDKSFEILSTVLEQIAVINGPEALRQIIKQIKELIPEIKEIHERQDRLDKERIEKIQSEKWEG